MLWRAKPARTVYFAFGHDEEVGGGFGASAMAELLEKEGIDFEHILDEGGTVLTDGLKGIMDTPVAVVGTAEKVSTWYPASRIMHKSKQSKKI